MDGADGDAGGAMRDAMGEVEGDGGCEEYRSGDRSDGEGCARTRHGAGVTRIRWGETTDDERDGFLCADLHGMSGRKCMLTGKKANNGRSISFSHIRNKTLQQVNLQVRRAAGDSSAHARWGGNPRT